MFTPAYTWQFERDLKRLRRTKSAKTGPPAIGHLVLKRASGLLIMPGDGMSMWPPPFLWHTIIGQCWPGALKVHRIELSGF